METIITERLELKPMCMDYLESTHEYASDSENTRYMTFLPNDNINLGVEHFIATCDTENAASKSVMEKLGMILIEERGGRHNKQFSEERREYLFRV